MPVNRTTVLGIWSIAFVLSGCGVNDELGKCLNSTEQTIMLRQLTASPNREMFDFCRKEQIGGAQSEEFCRGLYLNANAPVGSV